MSGSGSAIHRGSFLLYLNGLRVPCPSASVTAGVGSIPEATFSLAPHPMLQRLGSDDRVEVAIFYLDDILTPDAPEWRILFEGEIRGWSYGNTPMGTQMNFTAVGDFAIFKQLKYYFMTATDVIGHALTPGADSNSVTQAGAYYPFSLFKKGLVYGKGGKKEEVIPDIERPSEILYNAVRGMMDVNLQNDATGTPPAVPLVNFFARWARKRNFQNRFTALPFFEDADKVKKTVFPILESVQGDFAMKTLAASAGAGDQGTMFDVLTQVYNTMYFEIGMLPTAPAYRVRLADGYILGTQDGTSIPDTDLTSPMRLMNYFVKPQALFAVPPSCNVFFPAMVETIEYSEDYMSQPTRMYVNESMVTGMLQNDQFAAYALTVGYPDVVNAALRDKLGRSSAGADAVKTQARDVLASGKNVLVYPEEFYKGPVVENSSVPSWFTLLMTKHESTKVPEPGVVAPTTAAAEEPAPPKNLQELFNTYVRYEYFRKRYETRGGRVEMNWNPYVVPGFPCYIFDRRAAGLDIAGYVQGVTWTLSTGGLRTSVTYGYGRTLQEFLQTQYEDSKVHGEIAAGPAEILPSVRAVVQNKDNVEEYYRGVFYGRSKRFSDGHEKPASALLHDLVGVRNPAATGDSEVHSVALTFTRAPATTTTTTPTPALAVTAPLAGATTTSGSWWESPAAQMPVPATVGVNNALLTPGPDGKLGGVPDFNRELVPLPGMVETFNDERAAKAYAARPICSMDEYFRFRRGYSPYTVLPGETAYEKKTGTGMGAPFYVRLYKLRQGPAKVEPEPAMTGAAKATKTADAAVYTAEKKATPNDFPQTRVDWDALLEAYVAVLEQLPPLT